jgi:hypothetical protein
MIILKMGVKRNTAGMYGLDSLVPGEGPVMGSCEHDNDPSGPVKGTEFPEYICDYKILKDDSVPWSVRV